MEPFTTLSSGYYAGWQLRGTMSNEERRQLAQELEDNPETVAELLKGIRRGSSPNVMRGTVAASESGEGRWSDDGRESV